MKKTLSILLSFAMLLSITAELDMSAYASISGDFEYELLDDGTAEITDYTGSATDLTIPSTLDGFTVTSIGARAFMSCRNLTSVSIPNSVTSIGEDAFLYCDNLTSVSIPNSVTSIGNSAFEECISLTSVTIPDSVTTIGEIAFFCCYSLTSVTIGNSVKSIGAGAFAHCIGLTSVTIGRSVENIGGDAFELCRSLTSVTIPDSVTSIGNSAFNSCSSLTSITIGNSVTNIGKCAFYECESLTNVTIPNSVISIGENAFSSCKSLTSIEVDANNEFYSSVDGILFNKDKTLLIQYPGNNKKTSYTIPDSVKSIRECAFSYCTDLTNVIIPDSVTSIGRSAFYSCTDLTNVTIGNGVTTIDETAFSSCTRLASVTIGNSVESIGLEAFCSCESLTSVTIPASVTSISINAFLMCTSLTGIEVDANNKFYSSADGILFNKEKTELIEYPQGHKGSSYTIPNGVTHIGFAAFNHCTDLTSVTIPKSVTSIGGGAFYECQGLSDVYYYGTINEWNAIEFADYNSSLLNANIHFIENPEHIHTWNNGAITKQPTCTETGIKTYTCTCGGTKTESVPVIPHTGKTTITKATASKDGKIETTCSVCGQTLSTTVIPKASSVKLSATSYTYDGKAKKPSVKIVGSDGKTISADNYTVAYASGRKNVGKYAVTIKFKGNYSGTKTLYFTIKPKATSISSLTAGSKKFTVKWKKQTTQTTGYQIQYSTSSKFTNAKTVTVSKNSTTSKTISKLKAKKKYYVRVRTYKTVKVNGKSTKIYSSWSKAKSVTTKK